MTLKSIIPWAVSIFIILLIIVLLLPIIPGKSIAQVPSITLDWIAPGDDGMIGTASTYEMRWSTTAPDTTSQTTMGTWWAAATIITGLPTPNISGTAETFTVPGPFASSQTYYFVMKACDEVPNCSVYSNVAWKFVPDTLPPSRIIDLRIR